METETIKHIATYTAVAVPLTVAITNLAKIIIEWLSQRHKLTESRIAQTHQITQHYLEKTLDPSVPLAIRHQLLRFLATPDKRGRRLSNWAQAELSRIGEIIDETNKAVKIAEDELHRARTPEEIGIAEDKLVDAINNQKSIMLPPQKPPVTPASLRAGLINDKDLSHLHMPNSNLKRMRLTYVKLINANFENSNLMNANLQGCNLKSANLNGADLTEVNLWEADLRDADLRNTRMINTDLQKSRLEGADLRNATIVDCNVQATYSLTTLWPEGFDPAEAGAVLIEEDQHFEEQKSKSER